jgi:hypothetical protein
MIKCLININHTSVSQLSRTRKRRNTARSDAKCSQDHPRRWNQIQGGVNGIIQEQKVKKMIAVKESQAGDYNQRVRGTNRAEIKAEASLLIGTRNRRCNCHHLEGIQVDMQADVSLV